MTHNTQVAEWAGHSVHVLLTTYAKRIVGEQQRALRLIDASFAAEQDETQPPDEPPATHSDILPKHDRVHPESTRTRPQPPPAGPDQTPSVTDAELPDDDFGL